jgi:hypothetical protein
VSEQLTLDQAGGRVYTCCGLPCAPLGEDAPHFDYPHAEDCPNPNIGTFESGACMDRYGRWYRRLHCITEKDGVETCPYGGHCPPDPRSIDPYDGRCCLEIRSS